MLKFNSFLADLAESLAEKKIKVLVAGNKAELCYDHQGQPSILVLPEPSGDLDEATTRLYNGYVDHEISHVSYTDIKKRGEYKRRYDSNETALFIGQVAEDCHIECRRISKWRGSESNLMAVFELKLWDEYASEMVPATSLKSEVENFLKAAPTLMRALSGIAGHQAFLEKHIDKYNRVIQAIKDNRITLHQQTTEGAMEYAENLLLLLSQLHSQDDDSDPSPEDTDSDADTDGADDPGAGEPETEQSSAGDEVPTERHEGSESDFKQANGETNTDAQLSSIELPDADVGDVLADVLSTEAPSNENYSVFSKAYDRIGVNILDCLNELGYSDSALEPLSLPDQVSKMTSHIQRLIQGRTQTGWEGGKLSGRIDPKRIAAFKRGDDKVFRHRADNQDKSAAAVILVDMSYSMYRDGRMPTALQAAYALSLVMQNSGVKNIVLGHTTVDEKTKGKLPTTLREYVCLESSSHFNRIQPLLVPELKGWDEHPSPKKFACAGVENLYMDNVDGEVLDICCSMISSRPETKKFVFVVSDGYPDAIDGRRDTHGSNVYSHHLKEVINRWSSKVQLAGLGVQTEAVSEFFDKHAVVHDLEKLPEALMNLFNELVNTH